MTDKPMTVGELIEESEENLKNAVKQAYEAITNMGIDYELLEGGLRVAIDELENIQSLLDYADNDFPGEE